MQTDEPAHNRKSQLLPATQKQPTLAAGRLPPVHRSLSTGALKHTSPGSQDKQSGSKPRTPPLASRTATGWSTVGSPGSSMGGSSTSNVRSRSAGAPAATGLSVAEYTTANAQQLQAQVQLVQDAVGDCQSAYSKARADVTNCVQRIQQLEQQVRSLEDEERQLSAKVPLPVNRLCRVKQWLGERSAELETEQAALEGKQLAMLKAESQLRAREIEADLLAESAGSLGSNAAKTAAAALRHAAAAHEAEVQAANRHLKEMQVAAQQACRSEAAQQAEATRRIRAAEAGQVAAKKRLATSQAAIRAHATEVTQAAAAEEQRRRDALMLLKTKIDEVRENIGEKADRFRQLQKQKREQERREFEALQEQGLNPYEVYRLRDAEAAAAKAAADLAKQQAARMADIAAVLAEEEKEYKKKLCRRELDRQVEEKYQQEMGIAAQQQRIDAYMRSHTITGQAVLDPTSHLHPYPSESVLVKPAGFGLGRSSPEAVNKVARKHHGVLADLSDTLLLPSKFRVDLGPNKDASSSSDAPVSSRHAVGDMAEAYTSAAETTADGTADYNSEVGSDSAASSDSETGHAARQTSSSLSPCSRKTQKSQLQAAKISKFEAERLQQKKEQHKALVAKPKTSFGRTFAGDAFIADPPEVVFKDFVPGQTYKATVQLINRSFTKNSVRLLEVPAEVVNVMELDMPPSGSLAPGAAATLLVTFTPKVEADVSAMIPLLAETGPLWLPLSCRARQALPTIDPSPVVCLNGRAGGIMVAATGRKTVTISNAGALAVMYDMKVTGALASTTEYDEPEPPLPPPNATAADLAALAAKSNAATTLSVAGFRVQGIKGQVEGYGSLTFSVEFTPRVIGDVEVPLLVKFSAPENKSLVLQPVQFLLTATGRDLPVSTLTPVVDFKCVMFGQSYAAALQLANAGKSAMKVLVCSRPELNDWVEFIPDFGFIQAGDVLSVSVSLKPTLEMMSRLAKYLLPAAEGSTAAACSSDQSVFEVPLQVNVPGQTLPIPFKLRFQPTTTDLYLSPAMLDFGRVPLSESAGTYLSITNPSLLPQTFSFGAKLPLGLSISPGDGYGTVLPGETLNLLLQFQPPIPGVQYFGLTCRTLAGRMFKVQGKCEGLDLDVSLSHNSIKFPATAVNDAVSASVILRNSSTTAAQLFEFGVPASSCVQVTPRVGCLKPNSSLRIQLDFAPPLSLMESAKAGNATAAAVGTAAGGAAAVAESTAATAPGIAASANSPRKAATAPGNTAAVVPSVGAAGFQVQQVPTPTGATAGAADSNSNRSSTGDNSSSGKTRSERWMWHREWLLPCYIRAAGPGDESALVAASMAAVAGLTSSGGVSGTSSDSSSSTVLHLAVTTCAVAPELQLVAPVLPKPPGKNYWVMDFGALPVGERCTRSLLLTNTGPDVAPLSSGALDPEGVFAVVNALRPIEGFGGSGKVLLAFSPLACKEYYEVLSIRSAKSRLRIALKGRGITPSVSITPAAATSSNGGLAFGDVLLSDPVQKELKVTITNTCPFTISYSTRFIGPAPDAGACSVLGSTGPAAAGAAASGAGQQQQQQQQRKPAPTVQPAASATPAAAAPASATVKAATAEAPSEPSGCFYCRPCSGSLEAGKSQELTVVLAPAGLGSLGPKSPYVSDRLQILVPYQQQDVVIPLQAAVWSDGVFISGLTYSPSSATAGSNSAATGAAITPGLIASQASAATADPFAAITAAAAANIAAAAAALPSAAATSAKSKQGSTASMAATSQPLDAPTQQQLKALHIAGGMPAALAAAGYCNLSQGCVSLPGPIAPGQVSSATLEFGAVKGSTGGAAGELVIDDIPAAAKEAGWSIDNLKVSAPAGEKRPFVVKYTAPPAAAVQGNSQGALVELGVAAEQVLVLSCAMKGGCQPPAGATNLSTVSIGSDGVRRMKIVCTCVVGARAGSQSASDTELGTPHGASRAANK